MRYIFAAEEESDEEGVDVECIDDPSDVAVIIKKFDVGDRIKSPLGLRGIVVECHDNETYTVDYNDGR